MKSEFGIIGLGVMGKGLARNLAKHNFKLSLYNRHVSKKEEHVAINLIKDYSEFKNCKGFDDLKLFVESLQKPRKILIMVNAGDAVDYVISDLLNYIEAGDILIDGGNSFYKNTNKRIQQLAKSNIDLIGMGVSGGEEGALNGPSLMPGGNFASYEKIKPYIQSIAAKNENGDPCCQYIGDEGSGHFVKMVHNGIEYSEMQLLAEVYSILRQINGLNPNEISNLFEDWNTTSLQNYLLESTAIILKKKEDSDFLIDYVLDKASHKGTGSWTTIAAAELGVAFTMSSAALNARYVSALKEMRSQLSKTYSFKKSEAKKVDLGALKNAYQASRIVNHRQGFLLIAEASKAYNWNINLKNVANVWTSGCIIASDLMTELTKTLSKTSTILVDKSISKEINSNYEGLKEIVQIAFATNLPIPCLSESLNFLNTITQANGTGNIIQAQRDYFGAHTYKRNDETNGKDHHTNWNN